MRPRTLLVLALAVLALGGFVWFWERHQPGTEEREARGKLLLPWETDEVAELEIHRAGERARLVREVDDEDQEAPARFAARDWRLVEPLEAAADAMLIEGVLRALLGLERQRSLDDVDLADYGLAEPETRVVLRREDGEEAEIRVGRAVPGTDQRAVSLGGGPPVHLVAGDFHPQLERPPGDWRSREPFVWSRDRVRRVTLRGSQGEVVLAAGEPGFRISQPIVDVADPDAVEELLGALLGLRVESFLDRPPGEAFTGLDPPRAELEVTIEGEDEPFRLAWGGPVAGEPESEATSAPPPPAGEEPGRPTVAHYARAGDQVFTTRAALADAFSRPVAAWRSPALTLWRSYDLEGIEIAGQGLALAAHRAGGEWVEGDRTLDFTATSDLLSLLAEMRAVTVEAAVPPPGAPDLTVTLQPRAGEPQTLRFHRAGDDVLVAPGHRQVVLRLPAGALERLAAAVAAVAASEVPPAPASDDFALDEEEP